MTRKLIGAGLLFAIAAVLTAGCGQKSDTSSPSTPPASGSSTASAPAPSTGGGQSLQIAVIPKGTTHEYWKSVQAGAEQAGKEMNVDIVWKGPVQENDRAQQISIVQQFVSSGVNGIVIAPLDDTALVGPVKAAVAAKIPVVIIDSSLKATPGKDFVSFVSTDNYHGGVLAGQEMAKLLNGKGKVVLCHYMVGSASTTDREKGFLDTITKSPGITVIDQNHYLGATQGEAQTNSMQLIDTLKQADGIFTSNESATLGMLQALRQNGLAGKVKFVGFDATPSETDAIKAGQISAVVAQNPVHMGYLGVKTLVDSIRGKSAPTTIDTGAMEIDQANLNSPDVQKLLSGK